MNMHDLKFCPFCSHDKVRYNHEKQIICMNPNCGATVIFSSVKDSNIALAFKKWNGRKPISEATIISIEEVLRHLSKEYECYV